MSIVTQKEVEDGEKLKKKISCREECRMTAINVEGIIELE